MRRDVSGQRPPTTNDAKGWLQRLRWFLVHHLLHADDSPSRIARGVALGLFIGLTPTFGVQLIMYFPLAYLFRANRAAGFPFVWVTNAVTLVPIYWSCYFLGAKLLGMDPFALPLRELAADHGGWLDEIRYFWDLSMQYAAPLWLGCMLVAIFWGVVGYFFTEWAVTHYRIRKWGSIIVPRHHTGHGEDKEKVIGP